MKLEMWSCPHCDPDHHVRFPTSCEKAIDGHLWDQHPELHEPGRSRGYSASDGHLAAVT